MIDLHYDLLTYIYMKMKENDIEFIKDHCKKIYTDNITGGILNLFFMSKKEMKDELFVQENELNVINMLKTVTEVIEKYDLIPNAKQFIYGIEGCDYLESPQDLEKLYELGVRSINPVWNEVNKFGSGIRCTGGLTDLGIELIDIAVELGIAIDLSHTNNTTFWDIIKECTKLKNQERKPVVIASHSNCRELCKKDLEYINNRENAEKTLYYKRNLDNEQLLAIKELDGLVGIVAHKCLSKLTINRLDVANKNKDKEYIEALKQQFEYLIDLFGNTRNIGISTDDMGYEAHVESEYYLNSNQFPLEKTANCIEGLLRDIKCSEEEIRQIMYLNYADKLLQNS